MTYAHRRKKVIKLLRELDLDAFLFCQPQNLRYLCGFSGSDGALLVTSDQLVFLTDSRYTTQAGEEVSADQIIEYKTKNDGIVDQLKRFGAKRIGFETDLSYGVVQQLQNSAVDSWQWRAIKDELYGLRLLKTEDEIHRITTAADLNFEAFSEVDGLIRPGVSEKELALALEFAMRKRGADEKAFDIIVASGVRGALPHGVASDKTLQEGELVTIDFGCRFDGYHSDETVTLALGDVSAELRKIYDTVLEAHDRALAAVEPGIPLLELDRIAREYIKSMEYGAYFGHGLGHGVGLDVHESPAVSPRSSLTAEEGMVFTVEPGIYIVGVGGVRIEDMVLVTADGNRLLTKIPKTFRNILLN
jgi:Xaa-Pro aminopeptidase